MIRIWARTLAGYVYHYSAILLCMHHCMQKSCQTNFKRLYLKKKKFFKNGLKTTARRAKPAKGHGRLEKLALKNGLRFQITTKTTVELLNAPTVRAD